MPDNTPKKRTNGPRRVTKALAILPTAAIMKPVMATIRQPSLCVNAPDIMPEIKYKTRFETIQSIFMMYLYAFG